jgi:hypothetical protein
MKSSFSLIFFYLKKRRAVMAKGKFFNQVRSWLEKNPSGVYSDYKMAHPRSQVGRQYFYNTAYSWRQTKVTESKVDKILDPPAELQKNSRQQLDRLLYTELLNAAVNTVVTLRCNPKISLALEYAETTLEIANVISSDRLMMNKSIETLVEMAPKMTKDALIDNLAYLIGSGREGSVVDQGRRLQEVFSRLERVMKVA